MKKPKGPKIKSPKPISAWKLIRAAWADYRADWKSYVKILAVVSIPADLIIAFSGDPLTNSIILFVFVAMNVALIWAVSQRLKGHAVPGVARSYYDGTAALVRFVLTSGGLVAMFIPAAFGASFYVLGRFAADSSGVAGPELTGLTILAIAMAVPSLYWLTRYALAPFVVVHDDIRPMAALRRSRRATLGRFWSVAGRFILLGVFLAVVSIPATLVASVILSIFRQSQIASIVFNIASTLVALPLANIYLLRLYRNLHETAPAPAVAPAEKA
jgi:hypothetical protein